jgi:hypothetical protein
MTGLNMGQSRFIEDPSACVAYSKWKHNSSFKGMIVFVMDGTRDGEKCVMNLAVFEAHGMMMF